MIVLVAKANLLHHRRTFINYSYNSKQIQTKDKNGKKKEQNGE